MSEQLLCGREARITVTDVNPTSAETSAPLEAEQPRKPLPPLVPQPHGGAIRRGGTPGNRGGGVPSVLRARLRGSLKKRVRIAEQIADDPESLPVDRLRALDFLARYGLGLLQELSVEQVRERVRRTLEAIWDALPAEQAAPIIDTLRRVWAD